MSALWSRSVRIARSRHPGLGRMGVSLGLAARTRAVALAAVLGATATATAGMAMAFSGTLGPSPGTPRRAVSATGSSASATGFVTRGDRGSVTARATMVRPDGSRAVHSAAEHAAVMSRAKVPAAATAPVGGRRSGAAGSDQRPAAPSGVTIRAGRGAGTPGAGPGATLPGRPGPRRAIAEDVIRLARAQVEIRENKAGGGTKFHSWYVPSSRAAQTAKRDGGKPADYRNAPWCDIFVSWLGDRTGTTASMGSDAFTPEHAKWFQRRRRWGHQPKVGSLAFFDWNGKNSRDADAIDHVALVVGKNRSGTVKTIDGNISDKVVMKDRPLSSVVGFGYPDFAR